MKRDEVAGYCIISLVPKTLSNEYLLLSPVPHVSDVMLSSKIWLPIHGEHKPKLKIVFTINVLEIQTKAKAKIQKLLK